MPKRSSTPDFSQNALRVVEQAIGEPLTPSPKNPAAIELGRMGGRVGGNARAAKLTPEQRTAIARKAAQSRWKNRAAIV